MNECLACGAPSFGRFCGTCLADGTAAFHRQEARELKAAEDAAIAADMALLDYLDTYAPSPLALN